MSRLEQYKNLEKRYCDLQKILNETLKEISNSQFSITDCIKEDIKNHFLAKGLEIDVLLEMRVFENDRYQLRISYNDNDLYIYANKIWVHGEITDSLMTDINEIRNIIEKGQ